MKTSFVYVTYISISELISTLFKKKYIAFALGRFTNTIQNIQRYRDKTMDTKNVAVIGAGINGMSCAYLIQKKFPNFNVNVLSEKFSPNTTSNVAAGLWRAATVANTPRHRINKWAKDSYDYAVATLSSDSEASAKGYSFLHGYLISRKPINKTWYHMVSSPVFMDEDAVRKRFPHVDKDLKYGLSYSTICLEATKFIPYLTKEFQEKGGRLIQQKVTDLGELKGYDIIVNCSGLGARELVNDEKVHPLRGQIMRVEAPWVKEFVYDIDIQDGNVPYIIPNINYVIIGGTKQVNNTNPLPTEEDRKKILDGVQKLIPSLKNAKILEEVVGFRPGRDEIRLESELMCLDDEKLTVIHNYGHGSNGITLSWGCAVEVVELLTQCLKDESNQTKSNERKSNL